jgi:hypothetical protein
MNRNTLSFTWLVFVIATANLCANGAAAEDGTSITDCAFRLHTLNPQKGEDRIGTAFYAKPTESSERRLIITAYHVLQEMTDFFVVFDEENREQRRLTDIIEGTVMIKAAFDLAICECTKEGQRKLEGQWGDLSCNRRALVLSGGRHNGSQVVTVGNPRVQYPAAERRPLNLAAWASISEYTTWARILDQQCYDSKVADKAVIVMENIHITRGFSGGPVVLAPGASDSSQWRIVGMVVGGDPRHQSRCWAVPSDVILNAIIDERGADRMAITTTTWPVALLKKGGYSDSDDVISVQPSEGTIVETIERVIRKLQPREEYPVINLGIPIETQVQLFATDKVQVYGRGVTDIDVGFGWERVLPERTYLVKGVPGVPVIPRFRGTGHVKLHIIYSAKSQDADKRRDIRERKSEPSKSEPSAVLPVQFDELFGNLPSPKGKRAARIIPLEYSQISEG